MQFSCSQFTELLNLCGLMSLNSFGKFSLVTSFPILFLYLFLGLQLHLWLWFTCLFCSILFFLFFKIYASVWIFSIDFFLSSLIQSYVQSPIKPIKWVFKKIFIGVWLLYNVVLVSTVQQSESAINIHIFPLFLDFLPI